MSTFPLTEIDRKIITELSTDGRLPYKTLAERVGIATSTCHSRVQALEKRGVIRGYRAEIDPLAAGQLVSALILIGVHPMQRSLVPVIAEELRGIPGVQQVFLIGGDKDLIVHVSTESVHSLRKLIAEHLASKETLTQTQTQIVFEHLTGVSPL